MVFYFGDALLLWSVQRLVQYIIEEHSKEANVLALAPIRENMRESKPSKRLQEHLIRGYLSLQHRSCKVRRACAVAEKQCTECARHLRPQTFSRNCTKPAAPPTTGASHVRHRHGCFTHFRYVELERKPPAVAAVCSTAAGVRRAGFPTPHISTQQGFCCTGFRPRKEPNKYMATRTLPLPLVTSAPSRRTLDPARPRVSCAAGTTACGPSRHGVPHICARRIPSSCHRPTSKLLGVLLLRRIRLPALRARAPAADARHVRLRPFCLSMLLLACVARPEHQVARDDRITDSLS